MASGGVGVETSRTIASPGGLGDHGALDWSPGNTSTARAVVAAVVTRSGVDREWGWLGVE
jgi:hypothetical protein